MTRPHELRRLSIRTALGATALVGVVYLVICIGVVAFVTADLTRQIDERLSGSLAHARSQPPPVGSEPFEQAPDGPRFGPVLLGWTFMADGTVRQDSDTPELPAEYGRITTPRTVTLEGEELRITGRAIGDDYLVLGQSLDQVSRARSTVVAAELLIAPILLGLVFLGAVTIGRRVATPIERARQRQLEFTADASHELRTPLAVIEAQTSLALAQGRDATWYRTAFQRVDHESKRMRRLVEDMLWLARFDATQAPPNAEPVDLGLLAERTADRFGVVAEARRLHLEVRGQSAGAVVAAPPEWLDRLLGVLLDNACKYAQEGGLVRVSVSAEAPRVRMSVEDSGPGIAAHERERIFDRFHRATEGPGGAGLGLAIADAIVRATGGRWQVGESEAGGARMTVIWPSAFTGRREPVSPQTEARTATGD